MEKGYFIPPARRGNRCRTRAEAGRRPVVLRVVWSLPLVLAFAASPLVAQQTVTAPSWEPNRPPAQGWFEHEVQATMPSQLELSTSVASYMLPGPVEDSDALRNRAMEIVPRRDDYAVRRYRKGFFQRLQFSGSWIDRGGEDDLGISSLETSLSVAVPLGSFENLLIVTPGFQVDYLDGPAHLDAPPRLYNVGADFMWRKQFNDRWGSMLAVRPSVASDFQTSQDAIRITGRALATWQWVPERLTVVFGVVYLDRNDLPILPGVGLIWTPTPDWKIDLTFPRPKVARRLVFLPGEREDWVYLGAALGGRTWAVQLPSGESDQLTLRDYRLSLGWERVMEGGSGLFVEAGLVFGRELEYEVNPLTGSFNDAVMIRGGVNF